MAQLDPNDAANKPAEREPLAAQSLLLDLAVAGTRLVAVGERGHVLLSDDQGATWRQAKSVPTRVMLTAVFFADAEYGWAVGHDETILNTVDGGETWTRSHFAPEAQQPLLDLWFANRVSGIAVGAYGAYFTTNDGGSTWASAKFAPPPAPVAQRMTVRPRPTKASCRPTITSIASSASATGCTSRPKAASSIAPTIAAPAGACCPRPTKAASSAWCRSAARACWPSACAATCFARRTPARPGSKLESHTTAMLTDGVAINDLRVVIGGLAGVLLVSRDAGETFRLTQQDDRKGVSALLPGPPVRSSSRARAACAPFVSIRARTR